MPIRVRARPHLYIKEKLHKYETANAFCLTILPYSWYNKRIEIEITLKGFIICG